MTQSARLREYVEQAIGQSLIYYLMNKKKGNTVKCPYCGSTKPPSKVADLGKDYKHMYDKDQHKCQDCGTIGKKADFYKPK